MLIAQISDFHVVAPGQLAYGRVDTGSMLARAVEALNALDPRPDLVIASGDLVQAGSLVEYAALRAILSNLAIGVLPVVGNHDHRARLKDTFADLDLPFAPGPFVQYALQRDGLRIIVLDTITEGSDEASFCDRRAAWLQETLGASDAPTLIVTHHPLFLTGVAWMDPPDMSWADLLKAVVAQHHDRLVGLVSGHIHRAIHSHFVGIPASSCPSTAHQVALDFKAREPKLSHEAPGFQLHRWTGENLVTYTASLERFGDDFSPQVDKAALHV